MAPDERYITRAELNGSILQLQVSVDGLRKEVRDGFGEVYLKIDDRMDREQDKREACSIIHDERLSVLESCVGMHEQKLKIPGWAWKGFAAVVGIAVLVFDIILAVRVLAH
jgi:hypothetical protein